MCKRQVLLETTLSYRSINKQLHNFSDDYHLCTPGVCVIYKKLTNKSENFTILQCCHGKLHHQNPIAQYSFRHQYDERTVVYNCRDSGPLNKMWNRPAWSLKNPGGAEGNIIGPHGQQYQRLQINQDNERRNFSVSLKQHILITNSHKSSSSTVAISETRLKFIRKILCIEASLLWHNSSVQGKEKEWRTKVSWGIATNSRLIARLKLFNLLIQLKKIIL